jgi:predicted transcriptional regulator
MPHIKLTPQKVRNIKKLIIDGKLTQEQIASKYGVSRCQITKINLGMINPNDPNARWVHIVIQPEENLEDIFKLSEFK